MLTATFVPLSFTRLLLLTDTTAALLPAGAVRVVVAVQPDGRQVEVVRGTSESLLVPVPQDGPHLLRLQWLQPLTKVVLDESGLLPHITLGSIRQQAADAYVRHARFPGIAGNDGQWRRLAARCYAMRAQWAEGNYSMAAQLSSSFKGGYSSAEPVNVAASGLPHVPAGVTFQLDMPETGKVTVHVDIASELGLRAEVKSPLDELSQTRQMPAVTLGATRASVVFAAPFDGLYEVSLFAGRAPLTFFYIPVARAVFRAVREDSRALAHAFAGRSVTPSDTYLARLAHLIGHEAAAATGQKALSEKAYAAALAVAAPPTPTHLYPRP